MASVKTLNNTPWLVLDTETTGLDVLSASVLQVSVAMVEPRSSRMGAENKSRITRKHNMFIKSEVDIPQESVDIHGLTREWLDEHGEERSKVLAELWQMISDHVINGYPLLAYNGMFDFSILDTEFVRAGYEPLSVLFNGERPLADVFYLDKAVRPFHFPQTERRTLENVSRHYGATGFDFHDAMSDVEATVAVMDKMLDRYEDLRIAPLDMVYEVSRRNTYSPQDYFSYPFYKQTVSGSEMMYLKNGSNNG